MSDWLTAQEIAQSIGVTDRAVRKRANNESWPFRIDGRSRRFALNALPETYRAKIAEAMAKEKAKTSAHFVKGKALADRNLLGNQLSDRNQSESGQSGAAELMQLTGKAKLRAECKLAILSSWRSYLKPYIASNQKVEGEKAFAVLYNNHEIEYANDIYSVINSIAWNSPRRWQKTLEEKGAAALGGQYSSVKQHLIDQQPTLRDFCIGVMYHDPDIKATNLLKAITGQNHVGGNDWNIPSKSSVRRWMTEFALQNPLAMAHRKNPERFKGSNKVSWGNASESITHINQLWELDSTPSDVLLTDGRHSIIGAIDVYSRRVIVIVHKTSSAESICMMLRKGMLRFGVPEMVKIDNGKDYQSKRVTAVLSALNIDVATTNPFSGNEKSHIERFFRTWSHGISKLLPGYGGHNVAEREKIRNRVSFADRITKKGSADIEVSLSSKELQEIIDQWITHAYEHDHHRTIKTTPFDRWNEQRTLIRKIENERALDLLLSPIPASGGRAAGVRTVNNDVGILVGGISYFAPELGPFIGEEVFCSWDPTDIGRLYVFTGKDMGFICIAENPQMAGSSISLAELSKAAQALQNEERKKQTLQLRRAARKVSIDEAMTNYVKARASENQGVEPFPQPTTTDLGECYQAAVDATQHTPAKQGISDDEFKRRRAEQIAEQNAAQKVINEGPRFRSEFDEFQYLFRQKQLRSLSHEEIVRFENYRKQNPSQAKMMEKMLGSSEEKASR
ncbi:hypothetical protein C942_00967 [Photobacterium marinum]|uniref:Transposase n=1 Tax=Photobacterium marinum TaxID=1056511 RepID=L8JAI6_9GAMM|nr:DDE-type integrase/transposase/recombinase [Photobacterium marinum]ELR65880.1 hypothetical protein C942_00967 [Photobacterium marinum]